MADAIVTNEAPVTTNQWFCLFRLYETLLAAGWTHFRSSRGAGDTPSGTDRWAAAFGSIVSNGWIFITANSGQQLLFRRGGVSNTDGWLVWLPSGGATTTNETAELPGELPADAVFIRGSGAGPQTYTTDGPWFGVNVATVDRLNIGCRDATGSGDESFWIITKQQGVSYTTTTANAHGSLAFDSLAHPSGLGINDTIPYAWWCPSSLTGTWGSALENLDRLLNEDNAGGTAGRWRRIWNAGQGGAVLKQYGSGNLYQGDSFGSQQTGDAPGFDTAGDEVIYQATPQQLIRRIHLEKSLELAFQDSEGGWTQNIFFTQENDVPSLSTLINGAYAKFGNHLTVWWDGNAGNPPVE